MRSFVYLPLISTIVSLAFAMKSQEENTPDLAGEMTSEVNVESASGSGQNSPRGHQEEFFTSGSGQNSPQRHQGEFFSPGSGHNSPRRHQEEPFSSGSGHNSPQRHQGDPSTSYMARPHFNPNPFETESPPGSPRRMSKYGYLCQERLYPIQHLIKTATHACNYLTKKRQTNGRVKYPIKLNNVNQPNTQYIFPVLPENKIFNGGYFNFGLRLRHFLVIDSACERAKVTYRVSKDPRKSIKNWCSWPKCFSKGNSQYLDCPALYHIPDSSQPDYFQLPSN